MNGKLKTLLLLVLSGLLLGISPGTRLYSADDEPAGSRHHDHIESAAVQFMLVHIEREILEEITEESNALTLDSISLEKIGQCIHDEEGAEIISQTKLMVLNGHEAEITVIENERHKAKNPEEGDGEQEQREVEVSIRIEPEIHDGNTLAAAFVYKRSVVEEGFFSGEEAEEEEGNEQKFEVSSGVVLHTGQACIAGANLNEGIAKLLIIKVDLP
jgi:hypothetical protein